MKQKLTLNIGINYPNTSNQLYGCVNDANDWYSALILQHGYISTTTAPLVDNNATKQNIVEQISILISRLKYGDIGIITYSGHGTWVPDTSGDEPDHRDEALCPVDIFNNPNNILIDDELDALFENRARGAKIVLISDSCHSGTVMRMASPLNLNINTAAGSRLVRFLPPETFLSRKDLPNTANPLRASAPSRKYNGLLLSGCADIEYSYDAWFNNRANGAFTYAALQSMKQLLNSSTPVTFKAYWQRIRTMLPSIDYPQTPALYGRSDMKLWNI